MSDRVYYSPQWLAEGGPGIDSPSVGEVGENWVDMAAVALVVLPHSATPEGWRFGVVETGGRIVAAADTAAELIGYLDEYAEALDEQVQAVREWIQR